MAEPYVSAPSSPFSWEQDYKAVLLETNKSRVEDRIAIAQEALMALFLELTNREEDEVEIEAVERALQAIHGLKLKRS